MFPVRAGTKRLCEYFAASKRPAATISLIDELNDVEFSTQRLTAMHHIVQMSGPDQHMMITDLTPLGLLEDMTKGRIE